MIKKYYNRFIEKVIRKNCPIFPCQLSRIELFFNEGKFTIYLIDKYNNNVTDLFVRKQVPDYPNLYEAIVLEIENSTAFKSFEKDIIYTHRANYTPSVSPVFDGEAFRSARGESTMLDTAIKIGISKSSVFQIENDGYADIGVSTFVKTCLSFNKSPFYFISATYSNELLKITLDEFSRKCNFDDMEMMLIKRIKDKMIKS